MVFVHLLPTICKAVAKQVIGWFFPKTNIRDPIELNKLSWMGYQFDEALREQEPEEDQAFVRPTIEDTCQMLDETTLEAEGFIFETTKENVEALLGSFTNRKWINIWLGDDNQSLRFGIGEEPLKRCHRVDFHVNELFNVVRCVEFRHEPSGILFRKSVIEVRKFTYLVVMERVDEEADEELQMDEWEMQLLRSRARLLLQQLLPQMQVFSEGLPLTRAIQIKINRDFIR